MKKVNEANDSWDSMFPVNINKRSIPKIDLGTLYSEEDMFRVYDISSPKSLEILGNLLITGLIEHFNPITPTNTINQVRVMFNRSGYDFEVTSDRISALKSLTTNGYVDFPLSSVIPGKIEETFGYSMVVRIHAYPFDFTTDYGRIIPSQRYEGEIIPQNS